VNEQKVSYLRVGKAHPQDFGKCIARVDADTLLELSISPGDIVLITGKRTTAAKVWRAEKGDWGQQLIRLDGFTRQNAEVSVDERVAVTKAEPNEAKRIVLAPPPGSALQFGNVAQDMLRHQLARRPIMEDDLVPLMSSIQNPLFGRVMSNQAIPLKAVTVEPEGVVVVGDDTEVVLRDKPVSMDSVKATGITYDDIGGLKEEVRRIREMIELPILHPELFDKLGIDPPKGVLLHGPPGTGKTLLARAVANECGAEFYSIAGPEIMSKYYGESEQRLREIFESAEKTAPSIIFIDELDSIAPKREEVTGEVERRVVAQLLSMMDGMEQRGRVIVIGATNRVDAIDPALRRPGRFDREIEIGVPTPSDRLEILQIHTRGMPLEDVDMESLARRTHGFVGADLSALAKEAAMKTLRRYLPDIDLEQDIIPPEVLEVMSVTGEDFEASLKEVEPSAMREIFVEIPHVRWEDVGGMDDVRQELIETIDWPLRRPEKFTEMGIKSPKGILFYGPPGTGKTLLAKAAANESEANFINIRGPEMLSKWVGESERAIRETFRKARQVAPAVIFFDELDAMAGARGIDSGSKVGERVVNQLLTEMDGLENLSGVVVIGATNRPDMIDTALLRPGRFDRLVYCAPPDMESRLEILKIHTSKMPLTDDVDLKELARATEDYVGSDLEAVCREAAMLTMRGNDEASTVNMEAFKSALEKVKPTMNQSMRSYMDRVREKLKGQVPGERGPLVGYE